MFDKETSKENSEAKTKVKSRLEKMILDRDDLGSGKAA